MPAKDLYHEHVKQALIKDGWTITDDPLSLPWGSTTLKVDLGAERLIGAEKGTQKIAVEVKSFVSQSRTDDLEDALGQIVLYRYLLRKFQPERALFLALRVDVYQSFIRQPHVNGLLKAENVWLLVFDPVTEEIEEWISWNDTET
jgi:hypothetical protein